MGLSFLFPILIISTCFLHIQTALCLTPLYSICSNSQNFTSISPYRINLYKLLGDLYLKTPPTGFGLGSSGRNRDRAYGLALCRGDVSTSDCRTCVVEASSEITKRCPMDKGAIIWYDHCYLKYSDTDFLGKIDTQNKFYMSNFNNASTSADVFNRDARTLLGKLSGNACASTKMYASGEMDIDNSYKNETETIYGMVQCSRDVSRDDCKKCVDEGVGELTMCCGGKRGGRVVGGTCNIRYETYPFLNLWFYFIFCFFFKIFCKTLIEFSNLISCKLIFMIMYDHTLKWIKPSMFHFYWCIIHVALLRQLYDAICTIYIGYRLGYKTPTIATIKATHWIQVQAKMLASFSLLDQAM